jgi:multiple sugar transport system substrate-binding protein
MKSRLIVALLIATAFSVTCGGGESERPDDARVIRFWQFWSSPEAVTAWDSIIPLFEREHPGFQVELTDLTWAEGHDKIAMALSAGSPPDLVELGSDWVAGFAVSGSLTDLTDSALALVPDFRAWEPVRWDGRIVGLPWLVDTRCLFVNRNLLHFAGLPDSARRFTWPDLTEAVARIDSVAEDVYGFGANTAERHRLYKKVLPFFWAAGGGVFDDSGELVIDSPENIEALSFYVLLLPHSVIGTQAELDDAFCAGRVGFVISGSWLVKKLEGLTDPPLYAVTLMPEPSTECGTPASFSGGEYLVIPTGASEPEGAWLLARFLARAEIAAVLARATGVTFPAALGAEDDPYYRDDPDRSVFLAQMMYARPSPVHPRWVELESILESSVEEAMYGRRTPADALRECELRMKRVLAQRPPS